LFTEIPADEMLLYRISNCLCRPSYVSLHTALAYHQLLPEGVYMQTAITTQKTTRYETPMGYFNYRSIKSALYFGYEVLRYQNLPVLMAQPEKALLDLLYLTPAIKTIEDLVALRLNIMETEPGINWNRMALYEKLFNSETLSKKIKLLKETLSIVQPA
jgi:predicted transcriptional regulator of viral defense system